MTTSPILPIIIKLTPIWVTSKQINTQSVWNRCQLNICPSAGSVRCVQKAHLTEEEEQNHHPPLSGRSRAQPYCTAHMDSARSQVFSAGILAQVACFILPWRMTSRSWCWGLVGTYAKGRYYLWNQQEMKMNLVNSLALLLVWHAHAVRNLLYLHQFFWVTSGVYLSCAASNCQ